MWKNRKIFIAVPAFNEYFTHVTVEDAFEKADKPENIYFGIFNQKTNSNNFEDFTSYKNVRCINAIYEKPLGAALSRLIASTLHDNERYFLQIDAHTIFAKGWDSVLINDLNLLLKHVEKPMISQSCAWHQVPIYSDPDKKYIKNFDGVPAYPLFPEKGKPATHQDKTRINEEKFLGKFLEHHLCLAGSGLFSLSDFIYEISYNPFISFSPEQEFTALRSCTRGYRFFSSKRSMISTLGKNETDGFNELDYPGDRRFSFLELDELDKDKFGMIDHIYGKKFGFYGAPDLESYQDYLLRSKIDFNTSNVYGIQY
jgi:hypothetical protein